MFLGPTCILCELTAAPRIYSRSTFTYIIRLRLRYTFFFLCFSFNNVHTRLVGLVNVVSCFHTKWLARHSFQDTSFFFFLLFSYVTILPPLSIFFFALLFDDHHFGLWLYGAHRATTTRAACCCNERTHVHKSGRVPSSTLSFSLSFVCMCFSPF